MELLSHFEVRNARGVSELHRCGGTADDEQEDEGSSEECHHLKDW